MKIFTVVGARPQFIKAAALSHTLLNTSNYKHIEESILHTGQHFDQNMSDVFFEQMNIPRPKYSLDISGGNHGAMTGEMIKQIEGCLIKDKPDLVLVYGDTNSTFAAAVAASKLHIPIAHVEAGLRSWNMQMPEEINRILTDKVSQFLFCPTQTAIDNLLREGMPALQKEHGIPCHVVNTGDIMFDSIRIFSELNRALNPNKSEKGKVFVTLHRAENVDHEERLRSIVKALNKISKTEDLVFPLHPRTRKSLERFNIELDFDPIEPIGYLEVLDILSDASVVLTDSGGLQKEAYFFEKPTIVLRDETEWVELIKANAAHLVGANYEKILTTFEDQKSTAFKRDDSIFGNGFASTKIIDTILQNFN